MVWKEFHGSCLFSTTFKSFTQKQKQFLQMLWRSNGHKFSLPHAIKNRTSILLSPVLIHWHWSRLKKIVPKNASDGSSFFNPMPRQSLALLRQEAAVDIQAWLERQEKKVIFGLQFQQSVMLWRKIIVRSRDIQGKGWALGAAETIRSFHLARFPNPL